MRDYDIESDLKQEKFQSIKLVQGDRGNKIKINIYEDGQPVNLTGCSITAKYKRADGEVVNDGIIENINDNYFYAVMDSDITKASGTLKMIFTIEKDDVKVSTFLLLADVREGIGENTGSSGGNTGGGSGEVKIDLSNYYKKIETYSKNQIDSQLNTVANNQPTDLLLNSNNSLQLVNSRGSKLGNGITIPTADTKAREDITRLNSQLENKANKTEIFTMANMGQDIKEAITGGSVAVVDNDSILEGNVVIGQITPVTTDFLYTENLLDTSKSKLNCFIDRKNSADLLSSDIYDTSDFIRLEPNTDYNITPRARKIAFYSERNMVNKCVLFIDDAQNNYVFNSGTDKKYLMITYYKEDINKIQVRKGKEVATDYKPYEYNFKKPVTPLVELNKKYNDINSIVNMYDNRINEVIKTTNAFIFNQHSGFLQIDKNKVSFLNDERYHCKYTEKIPCKEGDEFLYKGISRSQAIACAFLGTNDVVIGSEILNVHTPTEKNIIIPANTSYVIFSSFTEIANDIVLEVSYKGKTFVNNLRTDVNTLQTGVNNLKTDVTNLKNGTNTLQTDVTNLKTNVNTLQTDVSEIKTNVRADGILYGKKLVACGDSFTEGDFTGYVDDNGLSYENSPLLYDSVRGMYRTYPWWIAERNNMTLVNEAKCGTTITRLPNFVNAFSEARYKNIPADADYILIKIGINDDAGHKKSPLGTINDTTNETFYGAWNVVLEYLITNHPWAKIGIIVTNGCTVDYANAIRESARKWGIPYLDEANGDHVPLLHRTVKSYVCNKAKELRDNQMRVSPNNLHPNIKAHEYESTFVENFLKSL